MPESLVPYKGVCSLGERTSFWGRYLTPRPLLLKQRGKKTNLGDTSDFVASLDGFAIGPQAPGPDVIGAPRNGEDLLNVLRIQDTDWVLNPDPSGLPSPFFSSQLARGHYPLAEAGGAD
jgi:hypothetical protein